MGSPGGGVGGSSSSGGNGNSGGGIGGGDNGGRGSDNDNNTSSSSSKTGSSQAGMTGSERTQDSKSKADGFDNAMGGAAKTNADRAAGPPGIGAPPDKPDTDDKPERPAGPPGIGAPPETALGPDEEKAVEMVEAIDERYGPPPSVPGLDPDAPSDERSFSDKMAVAGSAFAATFGSTFATGETFAGPTPVPHDDAAVFTGALGLGLAAAGYALYNELMNENPEAEPNETGKSSEGKTLGGHDVGDLSASGAEPDPADKSGELTKSGRALDKHGNRTGSVFDKPSGTPAEKNAQGQKTLDDIVDDDKGSVKESNRFGGFDVYDSEGRGARFDSEGKFRGFLEPPQQ